MPRNFSQESGYWALHVGDFKSTKVLSLMAFLNDDETQDSDVVKIFENAQNFDFQLLNHDFFYKLIKYKKKGEILIN